MKTKITRLQLALITKGASVHNFVIVRAAVIVTSNSQHRVTRDVARLNFFYILGLARRSQLVENGRAYVETRPLRSQRQRIASNSALWD